MCFCVRVLGAEISVWGERRTQTQQIEKAMEHTEFSGRPQHRLTGTQSSLTKLAQDDPCESKHIATDNKQTGQEEEGNVLWGETPLPDANNSIHLSARITERQATFYILFFPQWSTVVIGDMWVCNILIVLTPLCSPKRLSWIKSIYDSFYEVKWCEEEKACLVAILSECYWWLLIILL